MKEFFRKKYREYVPESFRSFVWRRIHDIRFLLSLPVFFPKQVYRNIVFKDTTICKKLVVKKIDLSFEVKDITELKVEFQNRNISFKEGEFAIYISDKMQLDEILPNISNSYPYDFGLKIIKSNIKSPDGTPFYCGTDSSPTATKLMMNIVGSVNDKKIISNILSEYDVAPRVYDLIKIQSGNNEIFAMVVEHIEGTLVEGERGEKFLDKFFSILEKESIKALGGKNSGDFSLPCFGNNIISNTKGIYYIDIQNFIIDYGVDGNDLMSDAINNNTHFGASNLLRSDKYSYQSVPELGIKGKRDSNYRTHLVGELLDRNNIDLYGEHVLDVGCNLGLFLKYALTQGAGWVVGLDMPNVANISRKHMYKNGFTLFDIFGVDLKSDALLEYIPYYKYKLVFYMSIEGHIGFPEWLDSISFEYMLYEGHEGESISDITNKIISSRISVIIIEKLKSQDGDSRTRPLLLCKSCTD